MRAAYGTRRKETVALARMHPFSPQYSLITSAVELINVDMQVSSTSSVKLTYAVTRDKRTTVH